MKYQRVVLVGGYGIVGGQIASLLRKRRPELSIALAGRSKEKAERLEKELGLASSIELDLEREETLRNLSGKADLIAAIVNDQDDLLLNWCLDNNVALIDIARWTERVKDAEQIVSKRKDPPPVILSSAWMAGLVPLIVQDLKRELGSLSSVDVDILYSLSDKAGPNSVEYMDRMEKGFEISTPEGVERVFPCTSPRKATFIDGNEAVTYRLDTPEQYTLPKQKDIKAVATRIAFDSAFSTKMLVWMVRSRLWNLLLSDKLTGLRRSLLYSPGTGGPARISIAARNGSKEKTVNIKAAQGQSHLTALGAVIQIERLLGCFGEEKIPGGVDYPENMKNPQVVWDFFREYGVESRLC